jgi:hypothetical protein
MPNYKRRIDARPASVGLLRTRRPIQSARSILPLLIICMLPSWSPAQSSSAAQVASGPITINGENGKTIENLHITSSTGNCLTIINSNGVTIRNSEIGPCRGNGIVALGGSGIHIVDNYIHPEFTGTACCDSGDGIYDNGTTDIQIQGNVIAYGETNVEILNSRTVNVLGNFLVNPRNFGQSRGSNIQVWQNSQSVLIENNYTLASLDKSLYTFPADQSDSMSFGGGVNGITVRNNYISGGFWPYGCGLIAESGSNNVQFLGNTLVDTGQCGIAIEGGTNHVVDRNRILNQTSLLGGGNTAVIVFKLDASDATCGPVSFTDNTAYGVKPGGQVSSFWNGGGCSPITSTGNTWDQAAFGALTQSNQKLSPPMIPPQPDSCVVASPFSNQTGFPGCNGPVSIKSVGAGAPVSDSFAAGSLNSSLWTLVDPAGDGSYSLTGTNLLLNVPAGSNHDPALGGNNAVRVVQSVGSSDFVVDVKFDSIPALQYQFQGIAVEQDAGNFLRFNFGSTGSALHVGASKIVSGAETGQLENAISLPAGSKSLWLRIQKSGDTWTEAWSSDGSAFKDVGSFDHALAPTQIGLFAGNYHSTASAAPAFTAYVDYFSNMDSPAE